MNIRSFISGISALIGGVLLNKAVPLGRVYSFPKEIRCLNGVGGNNPGRHYHLFAGGQEWEMEKEFGVHPAPQERWYKVCDEVDYDRPLGGGPKHYHKPRAFLLDTGTGLALVPFDHPLLDYIGEGE